MTSASENQQASIFFDSDGTPRQRPSFCVYVDILGFKDILTKADSTFRHFMESIRPAFRRFAIPSKNEPFYFPARWQAKVFSDNVFLVYPFERDIVAGDGEGEFDLVISKIACFQYECFLNDYFIRGGLSFGAMFIDEETIFGEPLTEVVAIEKYTAVFPRIALSHSIFPFLNTYSSFYANKQSPAFDDLLIDAEGTVFINYLNHVIQITEDYFEYEVEDRTMGCHYYDLQALKRHKEVVQNKLKEYVSKPEVFLKYLWLASYHNYCCKYYESCPDFSTSLCINGSFPDYGFRRLMPEDIKEYGSTRNGTGWK